MHWRRKSAVISIRKLCALVRKTVCPACGIVGLTFMLFQTKWILCVLLRDPGNVTRDDFLKLETFKENGEEEATPKQQRFFQTPLIHHKNPPCPSVPTRLFGNVTSAEIFQETSWSTVRARNKDISIGGRHAPKECRAHYKVAIIIPLRNRDAHLKILLAHMHPIWKRQEIDYKVFVITQAQGSMFNRGKLFNVGVSEVKKDEKFDDRKYDCYVFHDVDILLEDDRCLYWCHEKNPRHLSAYLDKFSYQPLNYSLMCHEYVPYTWRLSYQLGLALPLAKNFGGISMMTGVQFGNVNGFSNLYWGWGGEDDDLYRRVEAKGYSAANPYGKRCSYRMIPHEDEGDKIKTRARHLLLRYISARMDKEGLSSLRYRTLSYEENHLYTNITVDVGQPSHEMENFFRKHIELETDCQSKMPWEKYSC